MLAQSFKTAADQHRTVERQKACDALGEAIQSGKLGDIVAKHEKMILQHYEDVQAQAKHSFAKAISVAEVGFWVLTATLAYALVFDALRRLKIAPDVMTDASFAVGGIGLISGALIEFIAAVNFWLYARGARQFSAFHICLERTHRYLLAYKIADEMKGHKDQTLRDLVCIMANAPMITRQDIEPTPSSAAKPGGRDTGPNELATNIR